MKDSYGTDTYNVGYVRLLSNYQFIPAGMVGKVFIGQRASESSTMYTYVAFSKHIVNIIRTDDDDDNDDEEITDDKKYYFCELKLLDYKWSSKQDFEMIENNEVDLNMPAVVAYAYRKKRKRLLGKGKLVKKYNTICVKIDETYYKLDAQKLYVQLWSPAQGSTKVNYDY